jgi:hypothetical protein
MSFDAIATALADRRRRQLLFELLEHNPVDQAAVQSATAREDVAIQLQHNHLPKLESIGYVTWDREEGTITRGPLFDEIRPCLQLLRDHPE